MSSEAVVSLSERLARFTHGLTQHAIPAPVRHLARLHLVDALGVGLAAARVPAHRHFLDTLRAEAPGTGPASVFGSAGGAPAPLAALLNGSSIHSLEYDDTHMASIVHGGAVIVPTVLAAAETHALSLDQAITLIVAGWEALVRIGEASPGGFQRRGFQVTSVGGVVVAALLASVARGAGLAETTAAMGIAGSQSGGIFEFLSNGSNVKALHPGWAAQAGLWAASCAKAGMTGPHTVLEGRFGLYRAYADDAEAGARLALALAGLGSEWKLTEAAFKFFPCCHYIHPYLECVQLLMPGVGSVDAIASVHCRVAPGAATVICDPWHAKQNPATANEAKYSLPYCIARLLLGRPVDVPAMTAGHIDADAVALAQRIHWTPREDSDFPRAFDADLTIVRVDGERLHQAVPQVFGSAERPATDGAIRAKFNGNASAALTPEGCDALWHSVLDPAGSLADLQRALRAV